MERVYISNQPDTISRAKIVRLMEDAGLKISRAATTPADLHCTMIVSKNPIDFDTAERMIDPGRSYSALITDVDILGDTNDSLVLMVNSAQLKHRVATLTTALGIRSEYRRYTPHITVIFGNRLATRRHFGNMRDTMTKNGPFRISLTGEKVKKWYQ